MRIKTISIVIIMLLIIPVHAKTLDGIVEENGEYYCYKDGIIMTGEFTYNNNNYLADDNGKLLVGFQETKDGTKFYSRDKTKYGVQRKGKIKIGEDYYIFNDELKTNEFIYHNNNYLADDNGKLLVGFQETKEGTKFYSRDKTKYGIQRVGKFIIGEDYYIFDDILKTNSFVYDNANYLADKDGKLLVGLQETDKGKLFFSRDKTKYGEQRIGKFQIGEDYYIFDEELKTGNITYQDDKYLSDEDGKLLVGFQETPEGKKFYSRDKKKYGVMRTGTFMIGYNEYHFDNNGVFEYKQYIPYYYNQKDKRWNKVKYGGMTFGTTGCAPTSMAMAFTSMLEKEILPTDVANYLYNNTKEFNRKTAGSSGMAIKYASEYYNIAITPIKTKEEMIEALQEGYIVYGAMGDGKFATTRYNHAILLYKYENNKTMAMTMASDPLKRENNDWVTIDRIFAEQSKDPDDSTAGSNFYKLSLKDE